MPNITIVGMMPSQTAQPLAQKAKALVRRTFGSSSPVVLPSFRPTNCRAAAH